VEILVERGGARRGDAAGRGDAARRGDATGCRVLAVREVWQIDDEWWRLPISRLYYEAVLENGKLLTFYHDLVDGGWWAHTPEAPTIR
jgi:hypothetical protein